ncbi:MFS transporter [Burkholderia ambifaria]|uniref:MFS transporter n=1 Tax=Burkholderia ambifaria TaxID=152480 RepID=UPI00158A891A|nr:MFS transporter [Burkholderia ambifaria]
MEIRKINVYDLIDSRRIGRRQYFIVAFCALLMLFDGFDTQVISFIVPVLAKEWQLPKTVFGAIFSAVFFGLLIGNFSIPFATRRFGTKKIAFVATTAFGLFTVLTVFATSVPQLIALRFLTGIGLGAATPCAVGLVSEFSPKRTRATFVILVYLGYALGFIFAGLCSSALIPRFGWEGPLWLGGFAALGLTVLLIPLLPESVAYLSTKAEPAELLRATRRLFPDFTLQSDSELVTHEEKPADASVLGLFSARFRVGTFLLWAVFAINLAAFYFLQSWLPTVLASISFPPTLVVWATITVIIGGMVASLLMGPIMDRTSPYRILSAVYVGGAVSMYAISIAIGSSHLALLTTIFFCGFCISGGQTCAIALCTLFYSPELRAPGVAWAYGFGRLGAAGGTYLAGVLYANNWTVDAMFRVAAAPILIAAACVALMGACYGLTKNGLKKSFSA